jgi:ABC-type transport system substrate-binding protein
VGSVAEPFGDAKKDPKETLSMKFAQKALISGAMLLATIAGGAVGASFLGTASAQTDTSTTTAATATAPDPSQGGHVANGITEALLTGDTATKVTAAAQGAVSGATVDRVENDADGATYEAHMTKSDGRKVTVKVNADFSVASVEDGMK